MRMEASIMRLRGCLRALGSRPSRSAALEEEVPSWRRILLSGGRVSRALSRGRVSSKEMRGTSSPCPEARHLSEKEKARHPPGRESANSTLLETRSDSLKTHSKLA